MERKIMKTLIGTGYAIGVVATILGATIVLMGSNLGWAGPITALCFLAVGIVKTPKKTQYSSYKSI